MNVARLDTVFDERPRTFPIQTIAREMRKGNTTLANLHEDAPARTLAETTDYARELLEKRGEEAYNEIKKGMPQFMPAVTTTSRSIDDLIAFSELVCVEWDSPEMDIDSAMARLCQNPHVVMAWRSLRRKPKALYRIAPESINGEALSLYTFPHAWVTAALLFEELGDADTTAARPFQLQNICHDPNLYLNLDANKLDWSVDHETLLETMPDGFDTLTFALVSELGQEYIDAIERMEFNDKGIGKERVPCPFETHQNDGWGLRSNATRIIRHNENDYSLQCFKCSTRKRYNKTAQATPRYTVNNDHQHDTSDIDTERINNQNALEKWLQETEEKKGKHLLILGSAAGTGKTTAAVTTADGLLYIAKTTEEADSVFDALDSNEEDVIRHRSREFNINHADWETLPLGLEANQRPCIDPIRCNLHAQRLGTPNAVCQQCPLYTECKESGYHSQAEKERNTSKVVYAENEKLACDEIFAGRIKRICTKDDILIVDEVNPLGLTQERSLDRDLLFNLAERFRHPHEDTVDIYKMLKSLLDITSTAETSESFIKRIQEVIDNIDDISDIDEKIEKYPLGVIFSHTPPEAEHNQPFIATLIYQDEEKTVPVVNGETAHDTPAFFVPPENPIAVNRYEIRFVSYEYLLKVGFATLDDPPLRHRKLLRDLETFFQENRDLTSAPFIFDPKKQTFVYHLKPTLNHRRVIFNTASDPDNLIGEAYRGANIQITRHDGTPPVWKDALVFQLSTGNYLPRHSLLGYGDNKTLQLKPRAQELIDAYIVPSIKAGLKVLIVAPKAFQDVEAVKQLDCEVINHQHAEGRNDYQDYDIVFVFHYEPDHNTLHQQAKHIYSSHKTPVKFDRGKRTITQGSVTFEKNTYTDERVQAVYNRECNARLHQSAMRLRPNINTGKTIIFFTAEPIDIPVTPIAFRPSDKKHFTGDWRAFMETLHAIKTAEASGDTKAYAAATGQSERTARRKTQPARDQQTAERNADIVRRAETETHEQIAIAWGICEKTVQRTLRKHKETQHTGLDITDKPLLYNTNSDLSEMSTSQNADEPRINSEKAENDTPDSVEMFVMEKLNVTRSEACALLDLPISDPRCAELKKHIKRPDWREWCTLLKLPPADDWEDQIYTRYRDGESTTEIAEAVHITEAEVKQLLSTQAF